MQMHTSFYDNFNVMFFILLGCFLLSLTLLLLAKLCQVRLLKKVGWYLLQEGLLSLVLFSTFDICFSAGIHWQYADSSSNSYVSSSLVLYSSLCLLLLMLGLLEFGSKKYFGEFKRMFKRDRVSRLYITLTLLYRTVLALYISLTLDQPVTLLLLAFALAFLMYHLINLPYNNALHNYRASLTHFSQLLILLVGNYYKSLSAAPLSEKSHSYVPMLLVLVCLGISLAFSVIVFVY